MAQLPSVRSFGGPKIAQVNTPILTTDAGTRAPVAERQAAQDIGQFAESLNAAGERIQTRNESIERLRSVRSFREEATTKVNEFLTGDGVTSPEAVKDFTKQLRELEEKAVLSHTGRPESVIKLSDNLQSFNMGLVDKVTNAGYSAQQKMIGDEIDFIINNQRALVSENPGNFLTAYQDFEKSVEDLSLPESQRQKYKDSGLAVLAEATIDSFIDSNAIRDIPGMNNDAMDILNHPQVAGALGEERQRRIENKIQLALKPIKPSAFREQVDALVSTGVPEDVAIGVKTGRFVVSVNPQTSERQVIDVTNGSRVGGPGQPPIPKVVPSTMPDQMDLESVTGVEGVVTNTVNILSDAFGFGAENPQAQEATEALTNLNIRTVTLMQSSVPGRPSIFLLKKLEDLAIEPNSFLTGTSRAKTRMQQTRDMVAVEIQRMGNLLEQGEFKPKVMQEIRLNKAQLDGVLTDYNKVLESIGPGAFNFETPEDIGAADIDEVRNYVQGATKEDLQGLSKELRDAIEARLTGGN